MKWRNERGERTRTPAGRQTGEGQMRERRAGRRAGEGRVFMVRSGRGRLRPRLTGRILADPRRGWQPISARDFPVDFLAQSA